MMKKILVFVFLLLINFIVIGQQQFSGGLNTPPTTPATLPYSCDFEDPTENAQWVLSNSTCTNKWYIGTPSNVQTPLSGGRLFISSDNGVSNTYSLTSAGTVVASRQIQSSGASNYVLNFDLMIGGESTLDYLKVFIVDVDTTYNGATGTTYPYFAIAGFSLNQYMSGNAGVQYFNGYNGTAIVSGYYPRSITLPSLGPAGTVKKIVFVWKNDASAGTMPPACIDNLTITPSSCSAPTALVASNITINSIDLSWTANGTATQWNVYYKMYNDPTWTSVQATTNPYTLTGLNNSTNYQIRVQSDCITDQSAFSNMLTIATTCLPLSQFPFYEGFEAGFQTAPLAPGNAVAPLCWLNFNGGYASTSYIWKQTTTASYVRTGAAAAQQYTGGATYASNDYLITPVVTLTGNERLRFYAKGYSSYIDNIRVGIYDIAQNGHDITAITDSSLFTTILPNTIIEWTNWTEIIIPLNNYVGDFRLAFIRDLIGGYYLNIDDVTIETIPTCPQPVSSSVVLGVNTATINWVPANQSQGSFYLYYKTANVLNYDSVLVNSTSYTFPYLISDSTYSYYIKADCGTEFSAPTPVKKFKTLCSVITTLPYSELFDTYGTGTSAFPTCWYKLTTNPSYPSISTTNSSGPGSLYSTMAYAYGYSIAISPRIDASIPINTIKATLKFRATALDDTLYVGVITDPYDVTTFEQVGFLTASTAATFQDKEFYFTNYTGAGQHIAFKGAFSGNASAIYIDNLVLDAIPSCPNPTGLNVSSLMDVQVDLGWLENGTATTWNIEYGPNGFTPGTGTTISGVGSNPYTITGLTPQTAYQFYVQADCGAGMLSSWSNPYTFTTACPSIATLPWVDNFDNYGTGETVFPICWTKNSTVTNRPYINTTNFSSPASMYFYATSGNYNIAATPMINPSIPVNTLQVNFKYRNTNLTDTLFVGVMTNPMDASTFVPVGFVKHTTTATWVDKEITLSSYTGTGHYIAFKVGNSSLATYSYIDNLEISLIPSCPRPTQLNFSNIAPTSVDLNWIETGTATTWNIEYGAPGFTQGTGTMITGVSSNPYYLTGLTTHTTYQFYVQSDCGAGDISLWSTPFTFTTSCDDITTVPYSESFDAYGTGSGTFPTCWTKITNNTYPYINTTNSSAPGAMYMYAASGAYNYVTTAAFDPSISINSLSAYFKLYKSSAAYNITVGVMSDPYNMATFDSIANLTPSAITTWQTMNVDFTNYSGTGRHIAFKVQGIGATNAMYIDDFSVLPTPSCSIPTGLTDFDSLLTSSTITLDWSGADDANVLSWLVEYKPLDATIWQSQVANAHPFVLSGLESSVVYQIRISANCILGETTYPTNPINVGMPCESITAFPWSEGFEEAWFVAWGLNTATHPWCWTNINGGTQADGVWRKTTSAAYIHSGNGALQMYSGGTSAGLSGDYFITPTITLNGNERIRFWAKGYSTYTDILSVKIFDVTTNGIVDAEADTSLFVTILPNTTIPASTWTEYEIPLDQFVGNYQIAFVRNTTGGYYLNIDDIIIDTIPTCPDITQLNLLNTTTTDVSLNWTYNVNAGQGFEISYANVSTGFDPTTGTIISVPDGTPFPYTISNLTTGQYYSFAIRQACGGNWSNIVVANTDGLPATLPYACDFSSVTEQTSWKMANGNATNKFYIGTPSTVYPPISGNNLFISNDYGVSNTYTLTSTSTAVTSRLIEFTGDAAYRLSFDLYIGGESTFDYIKVFLTDPDTNFIGANSKPYFAVNSYAGNNQLLTNYNGTAPYFNGYNGSVITAGSYPREIILPSQGPAGTVKRLIIVWANDGSGGTPPPASIDNIEIEALTCPIPNTITVTNLTSNSTDVNWIDPSGTASEWVVKWKPVSSTIWEMATAYTTTYSISPLIPNTAYNVSVATVCGSDTSIYTSSNFTTPCAAVTSIPYSESFDIYGTASGAFPSCWFRPVLYSTYPSIVTTNALSSPGNLRFNSASAAQPTYAITPQLDVNINTLKVSFNLKAESITSSGTMQVGIMSDPNNLATFEVVETITPASTNYTNYEVMLTNTTLTGTGNYVAFKHVTASSSYYYWLDDVIINYAPSCVRPYQLVVSNLTTNSAQIAWTAGHATDNSWWIYWKPTTSTTYDSVLVSTNPFTLPGLSPATTYQMYMKTDCGTELSNASNTVTFTTPCLPLTTVPFVEYFDTYTTGSAGTFPSCWTKLTTNATYPYISSTNFSPTGSLYLYSSAANGYCHAITPMFDATIPINTLKAEFKLRNAATDDTLYVGVMTDPLNASTFELVQKLIPSATATWQDMEVYFNNYTGTGHYIAFKNVYTTTATTIYIDNLEIFAIPSCPRPTALTVSNITSNSVNLDWTEAGTATQWQIQYGATGFTLGTGTIINTSIHPANIPSLTPSTSYDFYVRAICGVGDTSVWSNKVVATTSCVPITTLPWNEGFESLTAATQLPVCWSATNFGTYTNSQIVDYTSYNRVAHTGTKAIYFRYSCNDRFFTPGFQLTAGVTYNFSYWYITDGLSGWSTLELGAYSGQTATTLVQTINTITSPNITTYTQVNATFTPTTSDVYYFGVFCQANSTPYYITMDDFSLTGPTVTCTTPTNLAVNNITSSTATATWTAGGSETQWEIAYKPTASSTWINTIVNTTPSYVLPTLTENTPYDVKVRAICGAGDTSSYSAIVNFTTLVAPCNTPTGLAVNNITDQSALATWTPGGSEASWQVEYKLLTSTNWTSATTSTPSYAIAGLQSNSNYHVRVKAICSSNESSFTTPVVFATIGGATFTITATSNNFGIITPSGSVVVNSGANQMFTFVPNTDCAIDSLVIDNGTPIPYSANTYTFSNVLANRSIHAIFRLVGGVDENNLAKMVALYPNPTNSYIELSFNETQLQVKECKVFDIYGKLLKIVPVTNDHTRIDVSDFANGVYVIRLESEMGTITKKFVKK